MVLTDTLDRLAPNGDEFWIRDRSDVWCAIRHPGVILSGYRKLHIDEAWKAPRTEHRLQFWQSVCGCQLAAWAFMAVLGTSIWHAWPIAGFNAWSVLGVLGQGFLLAVAAKLAAIAAARLLLVLELLRLSVRRTCKPTREARGLS